MELFGETFNINWRWSIWKSPITAHPIYLVMVNSFTTDVYEKRFCRTLDRKFGLILAKKFSRTTIIKLFTDQSQLIALPAGDCGPLILILTARKGGRSNLFPNVFNPFPMEVGKPAGVELGGDSVGSIKCRWHSMNVRGIQLRFETPLLEIITKYGVLIREWGRLYYALFEVPMGCLALLKMSI